MKKVVIIFWIIFLAVSANCQTNKEIDNLMSLINSKEYENQRSHIWIDLEPLKEKSDSLERLGKEALKLNDKERLEVLMKQYNNCTKEKFEVLCKYPHLVYSADYLLGLAMIEKDKTSKEPKIGSLAEYEKVYDSFSKKVKESYFGKGLKMLFETDIPKIGDIMPDIEFYSIDGNKVTLSDFKGKFVLLKTYFSGCGGWLIDKTKINEIYQELDSSKIVLIGIGIGDNKTGWADDVNKNKFPWISAFQPIGGEMTITFNINSNSRNVLIDPNGKIVDMNLPIQNGELLTRLEKNISK